ncbi:hypothetical protein IKH83_02235 [Candidatus Saccharibacteria bacterium]|nr:hypothetical protein [Candidatus Saccharibacteria bacterium]
MKRNRVILSISMIGLAGLILVLNLTSPTEAGPLGVLLFFTTLFIVIFGLVSFLMSVFYRMTSHKKEMGGKDYLYAAVITFGPIMLLMARSFGAISIWTVGLIFIFLFLVGFLVYKKV